MIWKFLTSAIKPVTDLVDDLYTSDEERLVLKNELAKIESKMGLKLLDYEKQLLSAQSNIIVAEAQDGSWLQKSWRPIITMLVFLALVVAGSFSWLGTPLALQAWTLLQIGLGVMWWVVALRK
ncbi:conserved hypothetical protein [Abyssogena phaseoliformis symbiont OG214]|uniref:3TM-type holin n=1 Tax=Abyssogena phaseoliformis symbiont TaxID=596095 RepID=UPI001935ABEA|nr:hypothetical protein [Candidatus Ruthia sp. Apha_13_S6]BBB22357.1 conserved hypothetical protein [Abyssogena phaseoliformis symbiont OG214]